MTALPAACRLLRRAVAVCALTCAASSATAQETTGAIRGRITTAADGGQLPVPQAQVTIEGSPRRALSDGQGFFILGSVPTGRRTVRVRAAGMRPTSREIEVRGGDTVHLDVALERDIQLLAPVRAEQSAEAAAFETRPSVATIALTAPAMAGVPKIGEPDVVRVVQLLPGVVSRNDFNTGLIVRGGEADQNLILLDGFPIYNPFHLGGLFSTFMDATVGGIELMTGAFPAAYGGRLSSVLDVRSADETKPGINTTADVSAIGTSVKLGGILGRQRGMWSIAGRRTYADVAAATFTENPFPYHFRDGHARVTYALSGNTRVSATAYNGKDVLALNLAEFQGDSGAPQARDGAWKFDWGNLVVGAALTREWSRGSMEQRVSSSGFSTELNVGDGAFSQRSAIRDYRVAGSLRISAGAHDIGAGYDGAVQRVRYSSGAVQTGTTDFDIEQRPLSGALWLQDLWRLSPRWLLQAGIRAEGQSSRQWMALSPRASAKFFATPDLALTAAVGRFTQVTHSLAGDGPLRYFDIWLASDSFIPVTTAWHYVAGVEQRVRTSGSVKVEGYVKRYDRVLEANASEDPGRRGDEFHTATGLSYGADMLVRWTTGPAFSGWLAYSYGLSTRTREGVRWAPGHDRRHDVDLVGTWRVRTYRLGARVGYASGTPYTPIVGQVVRRVYDPSLDRWGTGDPRLFTESIGGPRNSARFPATHRVDIDVSREFRVRGTLVAPYLSVVNVYNAKSVFVYLYNYSTDRPTRRAISQLPVIPSVGVRLVF